MGNRRCLILYLKDFFEANKFKAVTLDEIMDHLELAGISIGRRALYKYIDALRDYGMIIDGNTGRNAGYVCIDLEGAYAGYKGYYPQHYDDYLAATKVYKGDFLECRF